MSNNQSTFWQRVGQSETVRDLKNSWKPRSLLSSLGGVINQARQNVKEEVDAYAAKEKAIKPVAKLARQNEGNLALTLHLLQQVADQTGRELVLSEAKNVKLTDYGTELELYKTDVLGRQIGPSYFIPRMGGTATAYH